MGRWAKIWFFILQLGRSSAVLHRSRSKITQRKARASLDHPVLFGRQPDLLSLCLPNICRCRSVHTVFLICSPACLGWSVHRIIVLWNWVNVQWFSQCLLGCLCMFHGLFPCRKPVVTYFVLTSVTALIKKIHQILVSISNMFYTGTNIWWFPES